MQSWSMLVTRFEDLAVASAVGLCGNLDEAPDIAQEAFALAVDHIAALEDPNAFPAWLLKLVRTANNRRARRRGLATEHLCTVAADSRAGLVIDQTDGPEQAALKAAEAAQVRSAIERLPEGERCVIALHYLAGMPYADIAEFLDISIAAAKKRAWSARRRLKTTSPVATDALGAARPSGTKTFRNTVLVFQAIRAGDPELLARVLDHDPSLANVAEDWHPREGFESNLSFSEGATALVRAAASGDLRLVRLLVDAGAKIDGICGCADGESPLAAAVNVGAQDVAKYLVDQGASLDDAAFDGGSTALHVAVHKDLYGLERILLAAGADPTLTDHNGRTAADWRGLGEPSLPEPAESDMLWTRIRPIDLFAPLKRGDVVYLPPAYGLGAMRTVYGIVDSLDARFWMVGFEHGPYKVGDFHQEVRESGTRSTIDLVASRHPAEARFLFASTLERLRADPRPKVVMVVPAPGHEHDVTMALPGLAATSTVLATVVVAPFTLEPPVVPDGIPEGFDARITFDRTRARRRIWPAIDPARTSARVIPHARHEQVALAARQTLAHYATLDPGLNMPDTATFDDPAFAEQAQRLHRYLAHAFRPFEHLAAAPAANTPVAQLLCDVEEILGCSAER